MRDARRRRAPAAEGDKFLDRGARALKNRFHTAVPKVPDESGHAHLDRAVTRRISKVHTLDLPRDEHVSAHTDADGPWDRKGFDAGRGISAVHGADDPLPDPELAAIRARKLAELMSEPDAPEAPVEAPSAAIDHPIDVTDAGLTAFLKEHENVVIDCWAPWCGPCRIVGPIIDELASEMKGQVVFGKLNVDNNPATSRTFQIQSIPTLLVFRAGRLVDRVVGALPKPQLSTRFRRHFRSGSPGPRRI